MHPILQAALAKIHQEELLQAIQNEHLAAIASRPTRRCRWQPLRLHRALALLRLRRRSRRMKLARRRYPTAWHQDLRAILDHETPPWFT